MTDPRYPSTWTMTEILAAEAREEAKRERDRAEVAEDALTNAYAEGRKDEREELGWRPIETRPTDPRQFAYLVANATTGHVAPWINGVIHNVPGDDSADWQWGEAITHWMPFPPAPAWSKP